MDSDLSDVSYFESSGDEGGDGVAERGGGSLSAHHPVLTHHQPLSWSQVKLSDLESNAQLVLAGLTGGGAGGGAGAGGAGWVGGPGGPEREPDSDPPAVSPPPGSLEHLTYKELVALRAEYEQQSLQYQTHMREFVKGHFGETVRAIDTVRDVAEGVRALAGVDGREGERARRGEETTTSSSPPTSSSLSSFGALAAKLTALDLDAEAVFRSHLQRVKLSETLTQTLAVFDNHGNTDDNLILLPGRIRGWVREGDWEGFVRGCGRGVGALRVRSRRGQEATGGGRGRDGGEEPKNEQAEMFWVKLEEEVVKAAEGGVGVLLGRMRGGECCTQQGIYQAAEAACYLERLKRIDGFVGRTTLRDVDVLEGFVEGQVAGVMGALAVVDRGAKAKARGGEPLDAVVVTRELSEITMGWARGFWDMCQGMEGLRKRDAGNGAFVERLVAWEGRAETNTARRVFSGYAELMEGVVRRGVREAFDAVVTVDGISANVGPQQQVLEGLRGIVRAGMRVVGALNAVWGEWCASTEEDFRTPHPGAKSNGAKSQTRRGLLALPLSSAPSSASAHWLPPPVSLTPQVRDLFAHVIDEILHVLEDTLRTRIAPSAFLLVGERDTGRGDAAPKGAIGGGMMEAPTGIHINAGFLPRSNVVLLRTAIDEVMRCAASLGKHACLLHVPVEFKANAYLKAVSEACASSIVRYVYSVLEAGGGKSGGPGDHDGDHELRERERADACVDEFILLMACQMLESMKTTLLPGIITAHSSVLQLGDATASENSDAFKSCCAHLEDGQEALLKRWVEIKLQKLEPTMDVLLNHGLGSSSLSSGTEGKPSPAVRELMIILNAYDADISLTMPSLRDEVMGDIFLAVVDGWGNLVASEGASATRQARVDAESLKAWMVARLGSDDSEFETLLDGVTEAIEAIEAIETDLSHEDTQAALPEGNERKLSC